MEKKSCENNPPYFTQKELATRWKVSESTLSHWRSRGILPFFKVPGSTRILYPVMGIFEFEEQNTSKREVQKQRKPADRNGEKHVISAKSDMDWRI